MDAKQDNVILKHDTHNVYKLSLLVSLPLTLFFLSTNLSASLNSTSLYDLINDSQSSLQKNLFKDYHRDSSGLENLGMIR